VPSKYIVKEYVAEGIYHVYNRGVDKRDIFLDEQDYNFFIFLIKSYILPLSEQKINVETRMQKGAFHGRIEILAYAFMTNHYHLLIKQTNEQDLGDFMLALMTSYVSYFNKKYERSGHLFGGVFKAILVESDDYLLHLSRYIHLNPIATRLNLVEQDKLQGSTLLSELSRHYTSYAEYLHPVGSGQKWVKADTILEYFNNQSRGDLFGAKSYKAFVEDLMLNESDYLGFYTIE
jgi:putative transposase